MNNPNQENCTQRQEAIKIKSFIDNWLIENPYKENLQAHNEKFRSEFNQFLKSQKFSEETINLYNFSDGKK
jgi:hypothetical protein